jgi:predicted DNA-binding ribbon-helix-helix protein
MPDDDKLIRRGITLTEKQWRTIKARAASRGMTISEFFQEIANALPREKKA